MDTFSFLIICVAAVVLFFAGYFLGYKDSQDFYI